MNSKGVSISRINSFQFQNASRKILNIIILILQIWMIAQIGAGQSWGRKIILERRSTEQ